MKSYLDEVDTCDKSYILGYIANNMIDVEYIADIPNKITLYYNNINSNKIIKDFVTKFAVNINERNHCFIVKSELIIDILKHLNDGRKIDPQEKYMEHFLTKTQFKYSFLRAFFEKHLNSSVSKDIQQVVLIVDDENNADLFTKTFDIPFNKKSKNNNQICISYCDTNYIDLYGKLYHSENNYCDETDEVFKIFDLEKPKLYFKKMTNNAIIPSKAHFSDAGIDLTVIGICKRINKKTILCNTGIKLEIPNGYYVEIVPRSSIMKSGYMLSNSIGIIDTSYKGELFVALTKIDEESPEIEFPFRCCQMIMKKQYYPIIEETVEISETSRGEGGFGSSGK